MRASVLLLACLLLLLGSVATLPLMAESGPQSELPCTGLSPGPTRTVVRIIDGETAALDDGRELRLFGALAPRAIDVGAEQGGWAPEIKSRQALEILVLGKSVELAFAGDRADRYGRVLAHAFLIKADRRRWVQGYLLEQGHARADVPAGSRACVGELLALEREAREAGRGLWAEAAYQVRHASRPAELDAYSTTFQIVEGQVTHAALVRGRIYLNFDRNWRSGFAASLRSGDKVLLGPFADDLRAIEGRQVRVRGWIEGRGRPSINVSASGHLEVLEGLSSAADGSWSP